MLLGLSRPPWTVEYVVSGFHVLNVLVYEISTDLYHYKSSTLIGPCEGMCSCAL